MNPSQTVLSLDEIAERIRRLDNLEPLVTPLQALASQQPENSYCLNLCGALFQNLGRITDALGYFKQVWALAPDLTAASNLASAAYHSGEWACLEGLFNECEQMGIVGADLTYMQAQYALIKQDYKNGFALYESRLESNLMAGQKILDWRKDRLDGIPPLTQEVIKQGIEGAKILVLGEQGHGDIIFFLRFIKGLKDKGAEPLFLNFRPALNPLLKAGGDRLPFTLCETGAQLPKPDYHAPLFSLPFLFGLTSASNVPAPFPITPSNEAKQKAKQLFDRLSVDGGKHKNKIRLGVVASGQAGNYWNKLRSPPLPALCEAITQSFDYFDVINLQANLSEQDRAIFEANIQGKSSFIDWGQYQESFDDLAAQIEVVDTLITIDSAAAHLAGSMGKPDLLLLCDPPDWRWGLDSDKTPWYPSLTLMRQATTGDWQQPLMQLNERLNPWFLDH